MANNEINTDGITAIVCCIKANEASALRELDLTVRKKKLSKHSKNDEILYCFQHMVVTKDIHQICEDIAKMKDGKFVYRLGKNLGGK